MGKPCFKVCDNIVSDSLCIIFASATSGTFYPAAVINFSGSYFGTKEASLATGDRDVSFMSSISSMLQNPTHWAGWLAGTR